MEKKKDPTTGSFREKVKVSEAKSQKPTRLEGKRKGKGTEVRGETSGAKKKFDHKDKKIS